MVRGPDLHDRGCRCGPIRGVACDTRHRNHRDPRDTDIDMEQREHGNELSGAGVHRLRLHHHRHQCQQHHGDHLYDNHARELNRLLLACPGCECRWFRSVVRGAEFHHGGCNRRKWSPPTQVVRNGGFESGTADWAFTAGAGDRELRYHHTGI